MVLMRYQIGIDVRASNKPLDPPEFDIELIRGSIRSAMARMIELLDN